MMKLIKELMIIPLILVALFVLVIIRNSNPNIFKTEVKNAIKATQDNSNLITINQLKTKETPWTIIDLKSGDNQDSIHFGHSVQVPFEKLLDKASQRIFDEAKGGLILFSNDITTSSKAWVILNQLGYKNLLILTSEENPEELKYKFQPDSSARLEEDSI